MWETQDGKFTTSKKVNVYFFLTKFIATKIVSWKCHIDEFTTRRYGMILGRELLSALGRDLKFYENIDIGVKGPYEE